MATAHADHMVTDGQRISRNPERNRLQQTGKVYCWLTNKLYSYGEGQFPTAQIHVFCVYSSPPPAVWCVRQFPSPILTNLHQLMDPRAKTTSPQLRGIPKAPQLVEFGR